MLVSIAGASEKLPGPSAALSKVAALPLAVLSEVEDLPSKPTPEFRDELFSLPAPTLACYAIRYGQQSRYFPPLGASPSSGR